MKRMFVATAKSDLDAVIWGAIIKRCHPDVSNLYIEFDDFIDWDMSLASHLERRVDETSTD